MFDIHSHVLPCIDDGSKSVEESVAMLESLADQGVSTVAATPHFYAENMTPYAFFESRKASYDKLAPAISDIPVRLLLGAEVRYYEGIRAMDGLGDFSIEGTNQLLLEMPFETWSNRTIQSVLDIRAAGEVSVVLAHIDRYFAFQSDEVWNYLAEHGILMQVNADAFLNFRTRRKAIRMLRNGLITYLGSDCHNMTDRAPAVDKALSVIEKKMGISVTEYLMETEPNWTNTEGVL